MLLRVEQKDFKILWEVNIIMIQFNEHELINSVYQYYIQRNKQYMYGVINSLSQLTNSLGTKRKIKVEKLSYKKIFRSKTTYIWIRSITSSSGYKFWTF